ncbi:hypothetical protein AJ85_03065 [Alkalihalobacillus alcalophilus ATCC 27647 = CGMCC 1.3604]|uniref:Master regulator for biofilm formation n=1 Tax=Alkalihalobacillus alcalophilus ATCC 27647 = CGMCC 1.3604 TaxID=1218173 RepID=A0A094XIA5_ALKAL|nr:RicAFT regulatory complex protein RicA family protein [Alkalihalobacillus alcalophilus]KGA98520.1 hypothetical protein BALCAV_0203975 [Alkalihalobacillus alcalophilus ATCC 27647 = CGMCC 1.3604]MED1562670.1 RicAFT regulatory complex protein RicA family protein [Alkalihalobacillus alcalophilus]THG91701.1 hypothetical protein AJ85_03065 [Alkalihalobacillus alcalophilus ATCC 27647 = CGMCC 1.3604]
MEAKYTRQEVLTKAKELASMMAETEEVDFFKKAEKQINEHLRVQELIAQIKKLQKEAVNLKHYNKSEALKQTEAKIDELQDEIEQIPLVQEFQQSQVDVNDLLQMVSNTITKKITEEIITSMGGDVLRGTTTKNPLIQDHC